MTAPLDLYAFVYRGVLTNEAIRQAIPAQESDSKEPELDIQRRMPLEELDDALVLAARKMAWVYMAIAAFENSVRSFIEERLLEKVGATWWDTAVSMEIKRQAET